MVDLNCKKCKKFMGNLEKGMVRNGYVILCEQCWEKADAAIQMAEYALHTPDQSMPGFFEDLIGGFTKGKN